MRRKKMEDLVHFKFKKPIKNFFMKKQQIIDWIISRHRDTNHFYDTYLPYAFHLRMVVQVYNDFIELLPSSFPHDLIELACWGHDLIEDTRTSYNDCADNVHRFSADIIYAVSNEKGKNRSERANALADTSN